MVPDTPWIPTARPHVTDDLRSVSLHPQPDLLGKHERGGGRDDGIRVVVGRAAQRALVRRPVRGRDSSRRSEAESMARTGVPCILRRSASMAPADPGARCSLPSSVLTPVAARRGAGARGTAPGRREDVRIHDPRGRVRLRAIVVPVATPMLVWTSILLSILAV